MNAELKEMVAAMLVECEEYRKVLCAIEKPLPQDVSPETVLRNVQKLAVNALNRYQGNVGKRNGRDGDQSSCMVRITALLAEEP